MIVGTIDGNPGHQVRIELRRDEFVPICECGWDGGGWLRQFDADGAGLEHALDADR